jgi:two-component system, cell cycle sensor histidine kinase and response regulator CckA
MMNLVINARDAMPNGGEITVVIERLDAAPSHAAPLAGELGAGVVRLAVSDTGDGIPAELERIFEPFFSTKGESKGTGLGLATVFAATRQAGGSVTVSSQPGRTTFEVFLPALPDASLTAAAD